MSAKHFALLTLGVGLVLASMQCRRPTSPGRRGEAWPNDDQRVVDFGPRYSHDGRKIAFLRRVSRRIQLWVADANLRKYEVVAEAGEANPDVDLRTGVGGWTCDEAPRWAPDDRTILYPQCRWLDRQDGQRVPGTELWKFDLAARRAAPVLTHEDSENNEARPEAYYLRSPAVRADGRYLAAIVEGTYGRRWLVLRPEGAAIVGLALPDRYLDTDWPCWSPRDGKIAYAQGILRDMTADRVAVVRMSEPGGRDSRQVVKVTASSYRRICAVDVAAHGGTPIDVRIVGLAWSYDGEALYFSMTPDALDQSRYSVWRLALSNDATPVRVSPADDAGYLAPHPFADGRVGVLRVRGRRLQAVVLDKEQTITHSADLPSDDFDWAPDRHHVVTAGIATDASGLGLTVLRVHPVKGKE